MLHRIIDEMLEILVTSHQEVYIVEYLIILIFQSQALGLEIDETTDII